MKEFLKTFLQIFLGLFSLRFVSYYLAFILGTFVIVLSGFDWSYLLFVNKYVPRQLLFVSDVLGYILPTILIIYLSLNSYFKKTETARKVFLATFYSGLG